MRSKIMAVIFLAATLVVTHAATTQGQSQPSEAQPVSPAPTVVKRERMMPARVIRKRSKFTPWAQPSPAQVHQIIAIEARRWNAPAWKLTCRIRGESTFKWWEENGQYHGLGQFAEETFRRGMRSIGTRVVKLVEVRSTTRPTYIKRYWSDGHTTRTRSKRVRVKVVHTYRGVIPKYPARKHGWAQVRIMARAMVGMGQVHDGEWEVRC